MNTKTVTLELSETDAKRMLALCVRAPKVSDAEIELVRELQAAVSKNQLVEDECEAEVLRSLYNVGRMEAAAKRLRSNDAADVRASVKKISALFHAEVESVRANGSRTEKFVVGSIEDEIEDLELLLAKGRASEKKSEIWMALDVFEMCRSTWLREADARLA
jgi:hypothetical protein